MRRRGRRGYVLVVTLGLLVLAATLMVSIGRASLRRAAAAREAADDLQRRWGATSCRLAVMPAIQSVLVDQERKTRKPVAVHRARLRLGGQTFDLVLADEQAKANVNALLDESDRTQVETRLREAMTGTGMAHLVRVRPDLSVAPSRAARSGPSGAAATTTPATQPILPKRVTGFGQLFDDPAPQRLIAASQSVTCWGNGLVNVRRAPQAALQLATPLTGVEIAGLLRVREASAARGLIKFAGIKPRPGLHLTESSTCHSLWIVARSNRRDWHYFAVLDESDERSPALVTFVW
jgi:hypothetical protein